MAKINFTKEHHERLGLLAAEALFNGTTFKGNMGSELNIYDLIHNCNINTLTRYHGLIKKEVADIETLDDWSLTEHQQRKASTLKKTQELINLLIGYNRAKSEKESNKAKLAEVKAQYQKLKEDTKTPEDKMKEMEAAMAALEADA